MPLVGGGQSQKRSRFRLPGLPSLGLLLLIAPAAFLVWEYGKARTYTDGFFNRLWFIVTDTINMVGNTVEGVYRLVARGESFVTPFIDNAPPAYVLVCYPIEVNGGDTPERETERKLHIAQMEQNLHHQIFNHSGPVYVQLLEIFHKGEYPVLFMPLPEVRGYEILGHFKGTHQTCLGGTNPAVESHKIPVANFRS